eukprot:jgi/Psemu1/50517/gm1.50517_g
MTQTAVSWNEVRGIHFSFGPNFAADNTPGDLNTVFPGYCLIVQASSSLIMMVLRLSNRTQSLSSSPLSLHYSNLPSKPLVCIPTGRVIQKSTFNTMLRYYASTTTRDPDLIPRHSPDSGCFAQSFNSRSSISIDLYDSFSDPTLAPAISDVTFCYFISVVYIQGDDIAEGFPEVLGPSSASDVTRVDISGADVVGPRSTIDPSSSNPRSHSSHSNGLFYVNQCSTMHMPLYNPGVPLFPLVFDQLDVAYPCSLLGILSSLLTGTIHSGSGGVYHSVARAPLSTFRVSCRGISFFPLPPNSDAVQSAPTVRFDYLQFLLQIDYLRSPLALYDQHFTFHFIRSVRLVLQSSRFLRSITLIATTLRSPLDHSSQYIDLPISPTSGPTPCPASIALRRLPCAALVWTLSSRGLTHSLCLHALQPSHLLVN